MVWHCVDPVSVDTVQTELCNWEPHVVRSASSKEADTESLHLHRGAQNSKSSMWTTVKRGYSKSGHYLEHFPWKPCHFWRTRKAQEIKTVVTPPPHCKMSGDTLSSDYLCAQTESRRVSLHSRWCRIISGWLTSSCFCLTPEGPVFISTASITQKKNKTTSNYRGGLWKNSKLQIVSVLQ